MTTMYDTDDSLDLGHGIFTHINCFVGVIALHPVDFLVFFFKLFKSIGLQCNRILYDLHCGHCVVTMCDSL